MPSRAETFIFTVTDLAIFLGKSAVTIRGWERQGLVDLPRDSGGDRKLTLNDVRKVATFARDAGRITEHRRRIVEASCTLLELVEGGS